MKELISVVVPVYNVEEYLPKCLDNIRGQTYKNLEVILVDDGSQDGSGRICDEYVELDGRFRVIHQENRGVLAARNRGIAEAEGVYIGFVDGDDWIASDMYECLYREAKLQGADIVNCAKYIFDEASGNCYSQKWETDGCRGGEDHKEDNALGVVSEEITWSLSDKLFARELIVQNYEKVDCRLTYFEDAALAILCTIHAEKCVLLNQPMYFYRQRNHSLYHTIVPTWLEQVNIFYCNMRQVAADYSEAWLEKVKACVVDAAFIGLNTMMGLQLRHTIPFYIPPFSELHEKKRVVLYGAGKIGKSYYRMFQLVRPWQIVLWVDKQFERLQKEGLPVTGMESLLNMDFDICLIAVQWEDNAQVIRKELEAYGIASDKMMWRLPQTLLSDRA